MTTTVPTDEFTVPPVSTRELLMGSGPRFARDAFGPMLAFYVGWKLGGLVAGIGLSTVASMLAYWYERRHDRPGLMARISLGIVVLQALVGLVADSERVYLAQPVLITGLYGLAFLGSVAIKRPLTAAFANEMYPFPDEVKASVTYRKVFSRVSLAWGVYLLLRSAVRLVTLGNASVEAFLVVNVISGVPLTALLMGWSVWYSVRGFRRSEEWGPALQALDELQAAQAAQVAQPATPAADLGPLPAISSVV